MLTFNLANTLGDILHIHPHLTAREREAQINKKLICPRFTQNPLQAESRFTPRQGGPRVPALNYHTRLPCLCRSIFFNCEISVPCPVTYNTVLIISKYLIIRESVTGTSNHRKLDIQKLVRATKPIMLPNVTPAEPLYL